MRGLGGHDDLHVFFRAQLQPAFEAAGGVFGALSVVAVRQDNGQAAHASPFGFAGGDELVDGNLRAVGEITELRFPDGQHIGGGAGVAVFVGHNRFFVQN